MVGYKRKILVIDQLGIAFIDKLIFWTFNHSPHFCFQSHTPLHHWNNAAGCILQVSCFLHGLKILHSPAVIGYSLKCGLLRLLYAVILQIGMQFLPVLFSWNGGSNSI